MGGADALVILFLIYGTSSRLPWCMGFRIIKGNLRSPCLVILLTLSEMKSFKYANLHRVLLNYEKDAFCAKRSLLQALVLMVPSPRIYILFRHLRRKRD